MEEQRHYSVIEKHPRKITLKYQDEIIVESTNAFILKEVGKSVYNPVFYFPKEDIKIDLELDNSNKSFCPIKGEATYWKMKNHTFETYFGWSYEKALPRSKKIEGFIAFNLSNLSYFSEPL